MSEASEIAKIFEKMRQSEMNDWVGGSDPEVVGDHQAFMVKSLISITEGSKVLDFGCGIGRTIAALIKDIKPAELVGMDIMPPVIDFCNENLNPLYDQLKFEVVSADNDHYDHLKGGGTSRSHEQLIAEYDGHFNAGYALSVFTHIAADDFVNILKFVAELLAPGGEFLFTCFCLTPYSRYMIEQGQSLFPLENGVFQQGDGVFIGNVGDPLAFIAFERTDIERMAWEASLSVTKVQYGVWMGGGLGSWLQDCVVVRKPFALKEAGQIEMTPLVARD